MILVKEYKNNELLECTIVENEEQFNDYVEIVKMWKRSEYSDSFYDFMGSPEYHQYDRFDVYNELEEALEVLEDQQYIVKEINIDSL